MKWLAEKAVTRFITFVMLYLAAVGFGIFCLMRLPMDMYPDITFPLIGVVTSYEGASPEDVENLITRPVEEAVSAVEGTRQVSSGSRHGVSRVFIEFEWGADLDQAEIDVRRNLDFLDDILPDDARDPIAFAFDPSMQPIYVMAVYGPFDQSELRRICERQLEPRLERIEGGTCCHAEGAQQVAQLFTAQRVASKPTQDTAQIFGRERAAETAQQVTQLVRLQTGAKAAKQLAQRF